MQAFRDVRGLSVTTRWVARQRPDVVERLADDLTSCQSDLLRFITPSRLNGVDAASPVNIWDFNDAESEALQLWEVPLECNAIRGDTMPTVILPTARVLRLLLRTSRSVIAAAPSLNDVAYEAVHGKLRRLKGWADIISSLLEVSANRECLINPKLGLLEEVKSWHEDTGSDALLLRFLNQAQAPQTCISTGDREGGQQGESESSDAGSSSAESSVE